METRSFVVRTSKGVPNSPPNVAIQYQSEDTVVKQSSTVATSRPIYQEGLENNQTSVNTTQNIQGQNKFVSLLSDMNVPIVDMNTDNDFRNMETAVGKVHAGYPEVSVPTVVPHSMQEQPTGETDCHSIEFQTVPNTSDLGEQYTKTALKKVVLMQRLASSSASAPDEVNQELQDAVANISELSGKVEHGGSLDNVNIDGQQQAKSDRMNFDKHFQMFQSMPLEGCRQYDGIKSNKKQSQESKSNPQIPSKSFIVKKFTVEELNAIGTTEKDILSDFFNRTLLRKGKHKPLTPNKMKSQVNASTESENDSIKEVINNADERLEPSNNDGEKDNNVKLTSYKSPDENVCSTDEGNLEIKTRSKSLKRKKPNDDNCALTFLESRKYIKNHHDTKKTDNVGNDGENKILAGESHTNKYSFNEPVPYQDSDPKDPNVDAEVNDHKDDNVFNEEMNYWSDICKCFHYADKCVVKIAPILRKIIKNRKCEIEIEIEDSLQVSPLQKKKSDSGITSYSVVVTNPAPFEPIPLTIIACEKSASLIYNTREKSKRRVKPPARFDQDLTPFVTKDGFDKRDIVIGREIKIKEQSKNEIISNVKGNSRLRSSKKSGQTLTQLTTKSVSKMKNKENGTEEQGKSLKNGNTIVTTTYVCSDKLDHELKQSPSKKVLMKTKTRKNQQTKTKTKKKMTGKRHSKSQPTNVVNSFDDDSKLNSKTDYEEPFDNKMQATDDEMDDGTCVSQSLNSLEKDNSSCLDSSGKVDEEENLLMNKLTGCTKKLKQATVSKKTNGTKKMEKPKNYKVKIDEQGVRLFECPICGYTSRYSQNAVKHITAHTALSDFICDQCAATFNSSTKLARHMVVHQADRPFTCPLCPNTFKSKKIYHCDLCDHETKYGHHMRTHINRHIGHRPFQCETCGLSFTGQSNLILHRRQHNDTLFYDCQLCNKGFKDRGNYKQHMKRHVGFKEHVCEHCGKSFVISSDLKKHLRIHTGERPYKCSICEMGFRDSSSMNRHRNSHSHKHRFECGFCYKTFTRKDLCKSHMMNKHKDVEQPISINKVSSFTLCKERAENIEMTDLQQPEIRMANETEQNPLFEVATQEKPHSYEAPSQHYDGFDGRAAPNQSAYYQNRNPSIDGYDGDVNCPIYPGQMQYVVVQDDRGEVEFEGNLIIENV